MFGRVALIRNFVIQWGISHPTLFAVVVGLMLGAGFVWSQLWWVSFVGITASLLYCCRQHSLKSVTMFFFVSWWLKYLLAFSFIFSTYPLTWLGAEPGIWQLIMLCFFWLSCSLWLALGGVVTGALVGLVMRYSKKNVLLLLPVVWVVGEIAAPFFFSIFLYGEGGTINFNFSTGMIGYLFGYTTSGIWLAGWYGVYGLSFLFVSSATLLVAAYRPSGRHTFIIAGVVVGVFVMAITSVSTRAVPDRAPLSVITIHTQFDNDFRSVEGQVKKRDALHEAVTENLTKGANFLLTPEDSRYLNYQFGDMADEINRKYARFMLPKTETIVIDSGSTRLNDHSVLRGYIFDLSQSSLYVFDKQYLVPQGEFVPYFYGALFTAAGFGTAIERIKKNLSYRTSDYNDQQQLSLRYPSIMFCFESLNPRRAYTLARRGDIPFVAHPISHAWFTIPTILWEQQDMMLRIQARWSGVPIVSAGNMLQGKTYLPNGTIEYGTIISEGEYWEARFIEF